MRIGGEKTFGFCPRIIGKFFLPTNWHESARMFPNDKMATGSVARIVTNAMRGHVLWRSAFQAHRSRLAYPGTAYPVTIASLCTAFQADCPQRNIFAHELHEWTRIVAMD